MPEQLCKRFESDLALADALVVVTVRAAGILRIVDMKQLESAAAHGSHKCVQCRTHAARGGQIVAGGERVTGVEADAELRVVVQSSQIGAEIVNSGGQ